MNRRKRKIAYVLIIGILFFFLVPIVPMRVAYTVVLPAYNNCFTYSYTDDLAQGRPVYASLSYATIAYASGVPDAWGTFGLLYVPKSPLNVQQFVEAPVIQFPPIGFHRCY